MFNRNGPRDRDLARRPHPRVRRRWLALLAALAVAATAAVPALGTPTKDVTVDPGAAAGAPGFTDLDSLTYAQAKARLDELSDDHAPRHRPGPRADRRLRRPARLQRRRPLALAVRLGEPASLHGGNQTSTCSSPRSGPTTRRPSRSSRSPPRPTTSRCPRSTRCGTTPTATSASPPRAWPSPPPIRRSTRPRCPRPHATFYDEPVELTGGVNFAGDAASSTGRARRRVRLRRLLRRRRARGLARRLRRRAVRQRDRRPARRPAPEGHARQEPDGARVDRGAHLDLRVHAREPAPEPQRRRGPHASRSTARRTASTATSPSPPPVRSTAEIAPRRHARASAG